MGNTKAFSRWVDMRRRCNNPARPDYPNYGGRGIKVCERWDSSFAAYYADVGEAPSDLHMIDRIDNGGHYEPGNVRWALQVAQERNKRSNRQMTIRGEKMTMKEASERFGIAYNTLANRICTLKWDDEDAVFRPIR